MDHAARFARALGLRLPIFQAPVGSVAGPELAAAVAEAGALGALALTWRSPDEARRLFGEVRARTSKPVQANFVLAFEPRALHAALESGVGIVTFSWGVPGDELAVVRSFGARCGIQVTSGDGARRALDLGADFLICQGVEAGGHVQAARSLWDVLPRVVELAASVPVVASGGIGDGHGIARALAAGASAAMLGTRFVATRESLAHDLYKRRIVEASAPEALLTACFDGGWPYALHRVLDNSTLRAWEAAGCPPSTRRPGEGDEVAREPGGRAFLRYQDAPPLRDMHGHVEAMALYAGASCDAVHDTPTVRILVDRLWAECTSRQRRPTD